MAKFISKGIEVITNVIPKATSSILGGIKVGKNLSADENGKLDVNITEDLDMGDHKVTNVETPTDDTDAATKGYVDGVIPDVSGKIEWVDGGDGDYYIQRPDGSNVVGTDGNVYLRHELHDGWTAEWIASKQDKLDTNTDIEVSVINASGNVEIEGTLSVYSNVEMGEHSLNDVEAVYGVNDSDFGISAKGSGSLELKTESSDIYITSSGCVDITTENSDINIMPGGNSDLWVNSDISVANHKIKSLATPTDNSDAATKGYVDGKSYTLPTASASALGGVKVGSGLAIDGNGILSASGGGAVQLVRMWLTPSSGGRHIVSLPENVKNFSVLASAVYDDNDEYYLDASRVAFPKAAYCDGSSNTYCSLGCLSSGYHLVSIDGADNGNSLAIEVVVIDEDLNTLLVIYGIR